MVWAAFHYSANPKAVPLEAVFDPALAKKAAPLTREEVAQLAKKFQEQDESHAKALAEKDDLAAAKDAEIAELREQIKKAQAANQRWMTATTPKPRPATGSSMCCWPRQAGPSPRRRTGSSGHWHADPDGIGFVDYVLWGDDGLPLGTR